MNVIDRFRFQLSLKQMAKIIVFCAVAFAWIAATLEIRAMDRWNAVPAYMMVLLWAAGVPVVLAMVALILLERGLGRDGLVRILLLVSLAVFLVLLGWHLIAMVLAYRDNRRFDYPSLVGMSRRDEVAYWQSPSLKEIWLTLPIDLIVAAAFVFLLVATVKSLRSHVEVEGRNR